MADAVAEGDRPPHDALALFIVDHLKKMGTFLFLFFILFSSCES
jgi:hypothetical protein